MKMILTHIFNFVTIILLLITLFLVINKKRYYLISIVLIRFLPYYVLLYLTTLNIQKALIIILYLSYKYIKYNLNKYTIPNLNNINSQTYLDNFLIDVKRYIDINIINKPILKPDKNYIFLYSPHAIYSQGYIYLFGLNDTQLFIDKKKHRRIVPLVDPMLNNIPFMSELFTNFGFMGCGRDQVNKLLDNGNSIALVVGGIQELFKTESNTESIYINKRNSIFDISLQKNIEIVPVFASGESDWYEPIFKCDNIPNKYLSAGTYFFSWGKLYVPWMPKKNKLSIAFGEPISTQKFNTIDMIKQKYIKDVKYLNDVLNRHNKDNRPLKIY